LLEGRFLLSSGPLPALTPPGPPVAALVRSSAETPHGDPKDAQEAALVQEAKSTDARADAAGVSASQAAHQDNALPPGLDKKGANQGPAPQPGPLMLDAAAHAPVLLDPTAGEGAGLPGGRDAAFQEAPPTAVIVGAVAEGPAFVPLLIFTHMGLVTAPEDGLGEGFGAGKGPLIAANLGEARGSPFGGSEDTPSASEGGHLAAGGRLGSPFCVFAVETGQDGTGITTCYAVGGGGEGAEGALASSPSYALPGLLPPHELALERPSVPPAPERPEAPRLRALTPSAVEVVPTLITGSEGAGESKPQVAGHPDPLQWPAPALGSERPTEPGKAELLDWGDWATEALLGVVLRGAWNREPREKRQRPR
jgi:hypothetical protein